MKIKFNAKLVSKVQKQSFLEIGILKNIANFKRKYLRWSLFYTTLQALRIY